MQDPEETERIARLAEKIVTALEGEEFTQDELERALDAAEAAMVAELFPENEDKNQEETRH